LPLEQTSPTEESITITTGMGPTSTPGSHRKDGKLQQQLNIDKPKLWRKLQVHKSTALGLVVPFANLQLEVRQVDRADQDLGPAYITSKMHWEECFVTMLPKFELYAANEGSLSEMQSDGSRAIAKVDRPLWNCARSTLASIEMFKVDEQQSDHGLPSDIRKQWSLHQKGLGRHYDLKSDESVKEATEKTNAMVLVWKGSKHIIEHLEDYNPSCHGNLKLLGEDGTLLAAWKQQRDSKVLGSIHVFGEARYVVPVEVIVASCMCIAIVEKCTGVTWLGGL
jgi:hypothetical protein